LPTIHPTIHPQKAESEEELQKEGTNMREPAEDSMPWQQCEKSFCRFFLVYVLVSRAKKSGSHALGQLTQGKQQPSKYMSIVLCQWKHKYCVTILGPN
jgi:hypothetical protein